MRTIYCLFIINDCQVFASNIHYYAFSFFVAVFFSIISKPICKNTFLMSANLLFIHRLINTVISMFLI